ncbi:MAG: prepilin-type N-terminal cleavage/methylation domain-containing protein [Microgenomates group bacterium]
MKKKGFTLIELLVSLSIIAILIGLALVSYQGAQRSSRDGRRKADLEQIRSALEMCRTDTGSYPSGTLVSGNNITCGSVTYLTIPSDPLSDRQYVYTNIDRTSYTLCAALENGAGTVTGCGSCAKPNSSVVCNYKVTNP